jgi:hypothetical protein
MALDGSNLVELTWRHNKTPRSCTLNQTIISGFEINVDSSVCFKDSTVYCFEKENIAYTFYIHFKCILYVEMLHLQLTCFYFIDKNYLGFSKYFS